MTEQQGPLATPEEFERLGALAGTFGRRARVYHVGFVVPDLEVAVAEMSEILAVPFTAPFELPFPEVQTPDGPVRVKLRYAYSTRPANVELIQSVPRTLWDFDDRHRGHHLGVWTDDVAKEAERLADRGMPKLWWGNNDAGRPMFSFHLTPFGFYIELVDTVAMSFYPQWFAGFDPLVSPTT
jgi:hypothetical protein